MTDADTQARLEYLRGEIRAERISYGELSELQGLAAHIESHDTELLEWAGVPEFPEDEEDEMDPNETLRLLRLTIKQMRVDEDPGVRKAHAEEVAEYFEALDQWLSRGGFPPEAWREGPDAFGEERTAHLYSLPEIKDGTGFPEGVRFRVVMED